MATFTLASYALTVHNRDTEELVQLGDLPQGQTVRDVLTDFLAQFEDDFAHDEDRQKLFHIVDTSDRGPEIAGRVKTGDYGYEADLIDVNTGQTAHTRQREEAELLPFYFLTRLPDDRHTGGVLLQRFKQFGMKTTVWSKFQTAFNRTFPNLRLDLEPIVPGVLFQRYLDEGEIMKVRLIRDNIPSDVADAYREGAEETTGYTELVLSAGRNERFPGLKERLRGVMNRELEISEFIEVQQFEYENAKVQLDVNGSRRTIDLSDTGRIRPYLDVTDDIEVANSGHPTFESLDAVASEWMDEIWTDFVERDDE